MDRKLLEIQCKCAFFFKTKCIPLQNAVMHFDFTIVVNREAELYLVRKIK